MKGKLLNNQYISSKEKRMIILVGRNVVGSEIINEKEEMVKAHEREARSSDLRGGGGGGGNWAYLLGHCATKSLSFFFSVSDYLFME